MTRTPTNFYWKTYPQIGYEAYGAEGSWPRSDRVCAFCRRPFASKFEVDVHRDSCRAVQPVRDRMWRAVAQAPDAIVKA